AHAGSFALFADVAAERHPRLLGLAFAAEGIDPHYLPLPGAPPEPITALLRDPALRKSVHDAKTARRALRRVGADLAGVEVDTMIASYLVAAERRQHELPELARERLGMVIDDLPGTPAARRPAAPADREPPLKDRKDPKRQPSLDERAARAGASVIATLRLAPLFTEALERLGLDGLMRDIELPLVDALVELEEAGVKVDVPYLASLAKEFASETARIERAAHESVGHEFAINSPKQLGELLFEELHLPRGRRTKTGWSTDAAVLEELREAHPVAGLVLEYREVEKLRATYAEGLGALVDPATGRVHTTFDQTVAATGRVSSRSPNLQNIPIRTALGRRIRRAFVANEGKVLVAADYSQIELRVLAHVSQDPALLDAFRSNADLHRRTAAAGFGITEAEVTKEQRDVAKMLNFGIVYGMSDFGLASRMGMERKAAAAFIDEYFKRYAQIRRYVLETKSFCIEHGYVRTLLGRRRAIPDMTSSNGAVRGAAERMAINMPIQGTAADIMKIAMARLHKRLADRRLDATVVLQVHDELVLEVRAVQAEALAMILREEMSAAYPLDVPLVVEVRSGTNWDELRPIPTGTSG
ncbi:MAG: DNA polymerase I, partial [Chloroflexi bacterium]|nr:DNA polymerase I [Chloroflexota bacterium]